jgi:hypothetical protein
MTAIGQHFSRATKRPSANSKGNLDATSCSCTESLYRSAVPLNLSSFMLTTRKTSGTSNTATKVVSQAINDAIDLVSCDGDMEYFQSCSQSEYDAEPKRDASYRQELLSDNLGQFYRELAKLRIEDDEYSCSSDVDSECSDEDRKSLYDVGSFGELQFDFNTSRSN